MRKYNLNETFFDELNETSAYWLGFLYADGSVRMKYGRSGELKLKLKSTDKDHISIFLKDIQSDAPIKCGTSRNDGSKFCYVLINSNHMVRRLFELGCVQNKTLKIRLPKLVDELMSHFVRGYFDGDGCITKVKNRKNTFSVTICSNKNFNKDLVEYLNLGKIYEKENYSVIHINKIEEIKKFKSFIYPENVFSLLRKRSIFEQIIDGYKRDYETTVKRKKYKLTNPDGLVIITNNLRLSCEKNNLVYSTMSNLSRGIGKTNKGWKCELLINN